MKSLPTFSELRVQDIDEVFVTYVQTNVLEEMRAKAYLDEFLEQCLKSYNNVPGLPETNDAREALNHFLKQELDYAVRKLLETAGVTPTPDAIGEMLFPDLNYWNSHHALNPDHWLPQFHVSSSAWSQGGAGAARHPALQRLGVFGGPDELGANYGVRPTGSIAGVNAHGQALGLLKEIVGIKDWRNGNMYLETYLRMDYIENVLSPPGTSRTILSNLPDRYQGVVPYYKQDPIFDALFRDAPPSPTPTTQTIPGPVIEADDCAVDPIQLPGTQEIVPVDPNNADPSTLAAYFKSLRYGVRLVCQVVNDTNNNANGLHDHPFHAEMAGKVSLTNAGLNKSYHYKEIHAHERVDAYTFPIVSVEKEIPLSTPLADITHRTNPAVHATYLKDGYESAYPQLIEELKKTPEYSFMFDYCFPLNRMVSFAALYNTVFTLPYQGINSAFVATKEQLRGAFLSVSKSGNYQHRDLDWTNKGMAQLAVNGAPIPGFDFSKVVIQFFYGLLKGAGGNV